jgi:hypothetical protein
MPADGLAGGLRARDDQAKQGVSPACGQKVEKRVTEESSGQAPPSQRSGWKESTWAAFWRGRRSCEQLTGGCCEHGGGDGGHL